MRNLIKEAKIIINKRYKKDYFTVGCAIKTKSGKIYTGTCINSQKLDICSEWVAIGKAFSEGNYDIEMVATVKKHKDGSYEIYPPCALCRELYLTYCPKAKIVISEKQTKKASDLLPHAWQKNR